MSGVVYVLFFFFFFLRAYVLKVIPRTDGNSRTAPALPGICVASGPPCGFIQLDEMHQRQSSGVILRTPPPTTTAGGQVRPSVRGGEPQLRTRGMIVLRTG